MESVLNWALEYWRYLVGSGAALMIGKYAIEHRAAIWGFVKNFFWAICNPTLVTKIRKEIKWSDLSEKCPNCDARMRVLCSQSNRWQWWCQKCDEVFFVPIKR